MQTGKIFIHHVLIGVLGVTVSSTANAHFFAESPQCKAPKKPLQFVTDMDKKEFDKKVDEYRGCLEGFVQRQNAAMEKHKNGADKAATIWKNYAENELGLKVIPADTTASKATESKAQPDPTKAEATPQKTTENKPAR
ncbi:MAG: hypothetical protein OQK12_11250 [Motiliproteus sp.]|nr:hypothetical protein [Motiliproteus sp.]MCW9053026.1 hypothetical protein [Motiliproteus sp.]